MAFSKQLNCKKVQNKGEASPVTEADCTNAVSFTKLFFKKMKNKQTNKNLNPISFVYCRISARLQAFLTEIGSDFLDMHYIILFF